MAQLENIEAIERRLWGSADNLRAIQLCANHWKKLTLSGCVTGNPSLGWSPILSVPQ